MTRPVELSVLIPAYEESEWIDHSVRSVLASLEATETSGEVIVCDGGSGDGTRRAARQAGATRVVEGAAPNRPAQLNEGVGQATGDTIAIVHADSLVRPEWIEAIVQARRDGCVGGWAGIRIVPELQDGPATSASLGMMARGINWRTRVFRTATGEQGIFVDRQLFERIGGVPEVPIMDGYVLASQIEQIGEVAILGPLLRVSGRRWEHGGVIRTMLLMFAVRAGWKLGVGPPVLRRIWDRFSTRSA